MSLYAGKDDTGTSILHLTSGNTELLDMKGPPLANTVFHSELPYVTYTEYPCWATVVRGIPFIQVSQDTANALGNSTMFFITIGGVVVQSSQNTLTFTSGWMNIKYGMWFSIYNYNGGFYSPSFSPGGDYYLFLPPWGSNLSDIHVYALNIVNGTFLGVPKSNNEILINNDNFIVRGVDLLHLKYLSCNKINNSDLTYSLNGSYLQLINSIDTVGKHLSMISNRVESSIYRDSDAIYTSLVKGSVSYLGSGNATIGIGRYDINAYGTISLPALCIGSLCYLQISWSGGSTGSNTNWDMVNKPLLIKVGDGTTYPIIKLVNVGGSPTYAYAEVTTNSSNLNFHLYVYSSNVPRSNMRVKYIYFR